MKILHTEASPGWGGQEIRILKEALGMRKRGHEIFFAIQKGGLLIPQAKQEGFVVYELSFSKKSLPATLRQFYRILKTHSIDLINTHSSMDSWLAGFLGKMMNIPVIRTRHLSTPFKGGINARLLYNFLADYVVTTCEEVTLELAEKAKLPPTRCKSIPTGIDPAMMNPLPAEVAAFREKLGLKEGELLAGTLCILRGWKGVADFLHAAKILQPHSHIKWVIVGSGPSENYFLKMREELGLEKEVIFTGSLSDPKTALASMDLFLLLSHAHEGVSQATLQAAWLGKPLITTSTGGLKEVNLHEKTGLIVPTNSPQKVAEAILQLSSNPELCTKMGKEAHAHVEKSFTFEKMLNEMETLYSHLVKK